MRSQSSQIRKRRCSGIGRPIKASDGLTNIEATVLRHFALLDESNDGVTFSERRLAKHVLRMERQTLRRALKSLTDKGLVSVSRTSHSTTVHVLAVRPAVPRSQKRHPGLRHPGRGAPSSSPWRPGVDLELLAPEFSRARPTYPPNA